jgi:hypothetical protein
LALRHLTPLYESENTEPASRTVLVELVPAEHNDARDANKQVNQSELAGWAWLKFYGFVVDLGSMEAALEM